jgi:DNA-binding HxlR family transcriptional regulator
MSDRLLSTRLKELESAGLVRREVDSKPRLKVSYELTRKGDSLKPVLGAMREWARRWHPA